MAFSDIIGHEKQILTLKRALKRNRLHHAYLFLGPNGVGKKTIALTLAAALHCSRTDEDACGQCNECHRIRDGNHPDVCVIGPEKGKREITIVQMRKLQHMLELHSFSGKKKVAIIDPALQMNYHAQNSLLKTLEDPPGDTLIILIDQSTGNLLSTVLSRCLRLFFPLLSVEQATRILIHKRAWPEERAKALAAVTGGSVSEAQSDNPEELLDQRKDYIERFSALSGGDLRGAMALADEMAQDREKAIRFLQWIKEWYRDILIQQSGGTVAMIKNTDMIEKVREVAPTLTLYNTLDILSRLEIVGRYLQRNFNRRLVLEDLLINLVIQSPHVN